MTDEEDYEAEEDAEEEAARWWEALRARSVGTTDVSEWTYIWVGVMLRRYAAAHSGRDLSRYRGWRGWEKVVREQDTPYDPDGPDYEIINFLRELDSPWRISFDQVHYKWAIGRVPSLEEDIDYARAKQRKRMDEEQRLREEADRKQGLLQFPTGTSRETP